MGDIESRTILPLSNLTNNEVSLYFHISKSVADMLHASSNEATKDLLVMKERLEVIESVHRQNQENHRRLDRSINKVGGLVILAIDRFAMRSTRGAGCCRNRKQQMLCRGCRSGYHPTIFGRTGEP